MTKRALLILVAIIGACGGRDELPHSDRGSEPLELPPAGECTTLTGDVHLGDQADVDTFGARTCQTVEGSMLITGANDLSPLSDLTSVTGQLHIVENDISSLAGLEALASVHQLIIEDNPNLVNAAPRCGLDQQREQ